MAARLATVVGPVVDAAWRSAPPPAPRGPAEQHDRYSMVDGGRLERARRTRGDVARRLAAAVPGVAACEHAGVWLWDPDGECLCLAAQLPEDGRGGDLACQLLFASDLVELPELVREPRPFVVCLDRAGPAVRKVMEMSGLQRCAFAPIVARGVFIGVVAAGFDDRDGAVNDKGLLARIRGLADQAATAFDNADLLERLRHQAFHDGLTGLPNRALLEERAHQALLSLPRSGRHLSLPFVDLDRFMNVIDTLNTRLGRDTFNYGRD